MLRDSPHASNARALGAARQRALNAALRGVRVCATFGKVSGEGDLFSEQNATATVMLHMRLAAATKAELCPPTPLALTATALSPTHNDVSVEMASMTAHIAGTE